MGNKKGLPAGVVIFGFGCVFRIMIDRFEQFRARNSAQSEIENLLHHRLRIMRTGARQNPDQLFDTAEDAIRNRASIAFAHQAHFDSQIERALDHLRDAIVKLANLRVELTIESRRMIEEDVGQLALLQNESDDAAQIVAQLLDRIALVGADLDPQDARAHFGYDLLQQLGEQILLVLKIEIEG